MSNHDMNFLLQYDIVQYMLSSKNYVTTPNDDSVYSSSTCNLNSTTKEQRIGDILSLRGYFISHIAAKRANLHRLQRDLVVD